MGRPSKYETQVKPHLELIACWARCGDTDTVIAEKLGIATSTYCDYKTRFSEFSEVLKRGKEIIDCEVENSLLKRALGYEYEEVTREVVAGVERVVKTTIKQVVPDVTAQIFWLKNRQRDKWRDRQEVEHSGGIDTGNEYLKKIKEQMEKRTKG